jgi:thiosulfate dehydrogenase [quinone] large subunit
MPQNPRDSSTTKLRDSSTVETGGSSTTTSSRLAPLLGKGTTWRERASELGWVLVPLRLFIGVTFIYAGLSKIADSSFLDDDSPSGLHATLAAVRDSSPIGGLLDPVQSHSFFFGLLFAIAETAVGLGVLAGLFTRVAALGGMALALSFFLTVSWGADPYYTGADIVFAFAFTPLLIGGAGGVLSLDKWLEVARAADTEPAVDRTRRGLVAGGLGLLGVLAVTGASFARSPKSTEAADDPTPTVTPSTTTSATPSASASAPATSAASETPATTAAPSPTPTGAVLAKTADIAVGKGEQVNDPKTGAPTWVLQLEAGTYTAVRSECPHQGCEVDFVSPSKGFSCPCHDSTFNAAGKRLSGPATRDLTKVSVVVSGSDIHLA